MIGTNTGELLITGHADGNAHLAVGTAIVSGSDDTIIVHDPATGRATDDRIAFGVSSIAMHGDLLAVAERLIDTEVRIARVIGGKVSFAESYPLPGATTPANVAWSASGERFAVAYRANDRSSRAIR